VFPHRDRGDRNTRAAAPTLPLAAAGRAAAKRCAILVAEALMKFNVDENFGNWQPLGRRPIAPNHVLGKFSAANAIADAGIAQAPLLTK
jgi:hypothetical protein